jgi:hypothetical protein
MLILGWSDFKNIIGDGCGVVIDPITYRTAELFFLGRDRAMKETGEKKDEALFETIASNQGALYAFVDSLVLRKKLPMIAYSMTMYGPEEDPGGTPELLKLCNEVESDVVLDIRLTEGAYNPIKMDSINAINLECPRITQKLRNQVLPGLKSFNYRWTPNLKEVEGFERLPDDDRLLMTFLFGRVLFSRYAQASQADEVLPPKLGKLHVVTSLKSDEARSQIQREVFAGLKEIARVKKDCVTAVQEVPWAPTFLPHLLTEDPKTPSQLLKAAIKLREKPEVSAYREWLEELERDFDAAREPSPNKLRELEDIRQNLEKAVGLAPAEPIRVKWCVAVAQKLIGMPEVKASVEGEAKVRPQRLWGWISRKIAGDRYRKVLMDLVVGERRYRGHGVVPDLEGVWYGRR